jgi:hypothetical protein
MPQLFEEEAWEVTTVDTEPNNLVQYTPPPDSLVFLEIVAYARVIGGANGTSIFIKRFAFERVGTGAPALVGSPDEFKFIKGDGGKAQMTVSIVGVEIQYHVYGDLGFTIDWGVNSRALTKVFVKPWPPSAT